MPSTAQDPQPADVFVSFGISGDLARKMTFVSLYQLERRNLLELPDRRRRGGEAGPTTIFAGARPSRSRLRWGTPSPTRTSSTGSALG